MQPVDHRTLFELQILAEHHRAVSVFDFFNKTKTQGGRDYLKSLITHPRDTLSGLRSFQEMLKTITAAPELWEINFPKSYIMSVESYSTLNVVHSISKNAFKHWIDTFIFSLKNPEEFYRIQSGLTAVLMLIRAINQMLTSVTTSEIPKELAGDIAIHQEFLAQPDIKLFITENTSSPSKTVTFYLDYFFRVQHRKNLQQLLDFFYRLDAYLSIVKTAALHDFTFPLFNDYTCEFTADAIRHPLITNPVPNHFDLQVANPVCILTGANTSGKTTFLKTCGIVVYLAHLGWPVPANNVKMPFFKRLFTSIHLSDDLALGFSHFYSEVMLIRQMVQALHNGDRCFIIIDELFRGTNQDDALFCSKTVLDGFSGYQHSMFLVSTHLLTLIKDQEQSSNVVFKCFKTRITDQQFENSFQIEPGIAFEKVGSLIMKQSGIIEMFEHSRMLPKP